MVTKSLADITNMSMREKALHHKSGDDHSKHPLPLVDSYIDAAGGGDASRLSNFGGAGRDEDFENYGGPASVRSFAFKLKLKICSFKNEDI